MSRIRTIKPEILDDDKTAALSDSAYRLFTAMIVLADDHGNLRANESWLVSQIWWAHRKPPRVAAILGELQSANLVELYSVSEQIYAHIRTWTKHQRIDNAGKARVPAPSDGSPTSAEIRGEIPRNSARPPTSDHDPERRSRRGSRPLKASEEGTEIPEDWTPTPEHSAKALAKGLDVNALAESFRNHALTYARKCVRWNHAFSTWIAKEKPNSTPRPKPRLVVSGGELDLEDSP